MVLRVLLILILAVTWKGMLFHHLDGDESCHDGRDCPICQQIQETPADDVPASTGPHLDDCAEYAVVLIESHAISSAESRLLDPRAPPIA